MISDGERIFSSLGQTLSDNGELDNNYKRQIVEISHIRKSDEIAWKNF